MKNAVILHGKPSKEKYYDPEFPSSSNSFWIPWLQKQLIIRDIPTSTPEVPNNWRADYPTWLKEFERYDITPETILVGHSCGAGFMLRWLSEHQDLKVSKVVLAAPWLNPHKKYHSKEFFNFELDKYIAKRTNLRVLYSDDDEASVQETVKILRKAFPKAYFTELHDYGHFFDNRRMEFPELLEEILL
jgi:predicted alpha/beta hydrolase family esterase